MFSFYFNHQENYLKKKRMPFDGIFKLKIKINLPERVLSVTYLVLELYDYHYYCEYLHDFERKKNHSL